VQDVILVIDSQESVRRLLEINLADPNRQILSYEYPKDLVGAVETASPDLIILDMTGHEEEMGDFLDFMKLEYPKLPIILLSSKHDLETGIRAMKSGARDFIPKPISVDSLRETVTSTLAECIRETSLLERHRQFKTGSGLNFYKLQSESMTKVYEQAAQVAMSRDTTVLITGDSGTGKEIIGRLIHDLSPRREGPCVELNCASIPSELLESELFGHEKGSFTDAHAKKTGLVEAADGGTLFLDEIGEMPLALQVKILRFLETRTFRRVGGTQDLHVDLRFVSATNQDLENLVLQKLFRADLFYRLNVVPIHIAPLRERREDILPLLQFFGKDYVGRFNRRTLELDDEARRVLLEYDWPGNVRELKNFVERVVLMDSGEGLGAESFRGILGNDLARKSESVGEGLRRLLDEPLSDEGVDLESILKSLESDIIKKALQKCDGNQSQAAELLGLGRDKLRYRLKIHEGLKEEV
jgi:two-component system, NtrC family, response regulator AtoC